MEMFAQDLRRALRTLPRNPGFSLATILTVGLGIGAVATIFTLTNSILIRPLTYPESHRLVAVAHAAPGLDMTEADLSSGTYFHYREHSRAFADIAVYMENAVNLTGEAGPERVEVALATASLFSMLGATPVLGRLITEEDDRPYHPDRVTPVMLSHGLWTRHYGGDPGIIGRTILLNGDPKQVVGIMAPGFDFPSPETEVWYPLGLNPTTARFAGLYMPGVGRLRPGVSPQDAEADLQRLIPSLADVYSDATPELLENAQLSARVATLRDRIVGEVGSTLWMLLGGACCVLLIACANVANLFLMRAEHRRREAAVRLALGATRRNVARSFLAESLLLSALGGLLGLGLAYGAVRSVVALGPTNIPRLHEVALDGWVLVLTAGLAVFTGVLLGTIAALRYQPAGVVSGLKDGSQGATPSRERQRGHRLLVASQIALALILLNGSALLVQSFWRLMRVDPGFERENVLTFEIALTDPYTDYTRQAGFWRDLLERLRAIRGVEAAGSVVVLPLSASGFRSFLMEPLAAEGDPIAPNDVRRPVLLNLVTPGYFDALRIPLVEGRLFQPGARADDSNPVIISALLAERLFPNTNALGKRVRRADGRERPWLTIRAVVGSVRDESVAAQPTEILYIPVLDRQVGDYNPTHMSVAVRASLPPASLTPAVRQALREIDPMIPIANVRSMERIVADSMAHTSLAMLVLLVAAGVALCLSVVGVYAVLSYAVSRRTREIAVRMALGARPRQVTRMVLGQGVAVVVGGLAAGGVAALWLTGLLRTLLFEVSPTDPLTFAATSTFLLLLAVLAIYMPARRAAQVNQVEGLRQE